MTTPDDILPTYDAIARDWDLGRAKSLFEKRHLDRLLAFAPGRHILDLGCGSGRPIAQYLTDRRATVTGIDGAAAMISLFRAHLPGAEGIHADMRGLDLGRRFDAILAWNSFFHLSPQDQMDMFPVFAAHLRPRGVLMFTAGPDAGEPIGAVHGHPVYHASLSRSGYNAAFAKHGFDLVSFHPEDPDCHGHTVYLARKRHVIA